MNVLIFPTDDRSGLASMIYHYSKLGHKVFVPKKGTLGLNWQRIATWPAMLCKSFEDKTKRNLEIYPFEENLSFFGEDYFLKDFKSHNLYEEDIYCQIIDLTKQKCSIDVFHTLRGGESSLRQYFKIASEYFPNAKWVSSTMNAWDSSPENYKTRNAAKFIPANYENKNTDVNNVNVFCLPFEKSLLDITNVSISGYEDVSFASFNHNFEVRQPEDYKIFKKMNSLLREINLPEVINFGGNIRSAGADIRYSKENGVTGKFPTITPRQSYKITSRLKAAVHFKQTDWGGGVFYYCLNSGTPIITTNRYVNSSNASKYLIDNINCILVDDALKASNSIEKLLFDDSYVNKLRNGMLELQKEILNNSYWKKWENFIGELT
jgi:hypothetical protein